MNTKAVLAVGTIIVVLNVVLAFLGFAGIEFVNQQYRLQQKIIVLDQELGTKCAAIVREALNQEYSRRQNDADSLSTSRIQDFFGTPNKDSLQSNLISSSTAHITICEGSAKQVSDCIAKLGRAVPACQTNVYHPNREFSDTQIKVIIN